MSDTPERIWIGELLWGDSPDPRKVEYVRADMHAAVTAERDALRQDAERYRWLRTRINYRDVVPPASLGGLWPPTERQWTHISYDMSNETIDESIDAAMSR